MNKPVHNLDIVTLRQRKERGFSSVMTTIYLVIFIAGGALLYFGGWRPAWKLLASTFWQKTACQIVRSGLETKESNDSKTSKTTYYEVPFIVYSYSFNSSNYQSDRYNFWEIGATDVDRAVIQNNPSGKQSVCLVNPANPAEAVFYPMIPLAMGFILFWGVLLFLAGGGGLVYDFSSYLRATGWFRLRRKFAQKSTLPIQTGQIVLQSKWKPKKGFFYFLLAATIIWNSFNLLFLLTFFRQLRSGTTDFISIIFPLFIGVILAIFTVRKYLSFLEPQPILTIQAYAIRIGEPFDLSWEFSGRVKLVTDLQIFLEAFEIDNRPEINADEKKPAYKPKDQKLTSMQVVSGWSNEQGKTTVTIPADCKPTMKDENKEIYWRFRALWGTYKQAENERKFAIVVLPDFESSRLTIQPAVSN